MIIQIILSFIYIFYLYKKSYKLKNIYDLNVLVIHAVICETFIVFFSIADLISVHLWALLYLFAYYVLVFLLLFLRKRIVFVKKSTYIISIEEEKFFLYKILVFFQNPLKFL